VQLNHAVVGLIQRVLQLVVRVLELSSLVTIEVPARFRRYKRFHQVVHLGNCDCYSPWLFGVHLHHLLSNSQNGFRERTVTLNNKHSAVRPTYLLHLTDNRNTRLPQLHDFPTVANEPHEKKSSTALP
jgi:hypothetical protein